MCLCLIFDRAVGNNNLARGFCNGCKRSKCWEEDIACTVYWRLANAMLNMVRTTQSTKRSFAGPDRANNCVSIYNFLGLTQTVCHSATELVLAKNLSIQNSSAKQRIFVSCVGCIVGWVEFSSSFIVVRAGVVH